jgi:hypothetical protein
LIGAFPDEACVVFPKPDKPQGMHLPQTTPGNPRGRRFFCKGIGKDGRKQYSGSMYDFCLPTNAKAVPDSPEGFHEIKYDGFRLLVRRDDKRVRLLSTKGHDFTDRYPWIVEAARKIRRTSFAIDGEAVVLGVDGISDFDALWSRHHDDEVQLGALDLLMEEGEDLRKMPLHLRKHKLDRVLVRRPESIFVNPYESGAIGPALFQAACDMGFEGLVSKHRNRPYQGGRSRHWIKVKNQKHPAMQRVMESLKKLEWPGEIRSPWAMNVTAALPAARPSRFRCVYHRSKLLKLRLQFHELENFSAQNSRTVESQGAATHGPSQTHSLAQSSAPSKLCNATARKDSETTSRFFASK